ncbi:serine protease 27-like [Argiope bruennichi]|uniref:serine protease 27-like n=1 Tax=Argiope bruennichi TaxID=94029 RepID=UPI002495A73E|nr:serine protease 27-like [Argiope bruennichi]
MLMEANLLRDSCDCGRESIERAPFIYRIVSTTFVQPLHRYPWIVQIRIAGEQWGAGVIITPSYVLTAGHVGKNILVAASYSEDNEVSLKDASVAVATQSKNSEFVTFRIHQVKFHPKFGTYGEYPIYDIALLKLKDTIIFSKRIRPICLTDNKNLEKPGLNATVIGWGKMEQASKGQDASRTIKHNSSTIGPIAEIPEDSSIHFIAKVAKLVAKPRDY